MPSSSATEALLAGALDWADAGYRIHPCDPETKRPLTKWGTAATTDSGVIKDWWAYDFQGALIAVCTGNGLVVVDDDRGNDEPEDDMALTLTSKTRSRGWHHWFRDPTGIIGNRVGIIPGVDIRGNGGYVIAPPSPGWTWHNANDIQTLPEWVVTLMSAHQQRGRGFGRGFQPAREPVGEGQRNDYIARFAGCVLRLGITDSISELGAFCLTENQRIVSPPLASLEVLRTARSIFETEQRRNGA